MLELGTNSVEKQQKHSMLLHILLLYIMYSINIVYYIDSFMLLLCITWQCLLKP